MPTTPSAAGLADRLKSATAARHRRAEERPLQRALAAATIERERHARWALVMLALHAALEQGLRRLVVARGDLDGLDALVAGHGRHVANLERDVAAAAAAGRLPAPVRAADAAAHAGPATRDVVARIDRRAAEDPTSLLGWLYVLEGSMNGNRFIAARLAEAWGDAGGLAYLDPDGAEQRSRWLAWRAELDALPLTAAEQAAIEAAAAEAFDGVAAASDEVAAG